jgi:hypothetical protein
LYLFPEGIQRLSIARNSVVIEVSLHYRFQPSTLFRYRLMPIPVQCFPDLFDFGPEPLGDGFPVDCETAVSPLSADVREAEKVEGFRLPFPTLLPVRYGKPSEFNQAGFPVMHCQSELGQPFFQFLLKAFRVPSVLKAHDESSSAEESHPNALTEPD